MVISETYFGKRLIDLGKLYGYQIRFKWGIPYPRINIYVIKVSCPYKEAMIHIDLKDIPKGDGFDLIDFVNVVFDVLKEEVDGYEIPYIEENPVNCRCSDLTKILKEYNSMFVKKEYPTYPEIKNVIFNPPATIVFWDDGTKTVVKALNGEYFDPEKGLSMAIAKKYFGNKGHYFEEIKKWTEKYEGYFITADSMRKAIEEAIKEKGDYSAEYALFKELFIDPCIEYLSHLNDKPEGTDA